MDWNDREQIERPALENSDRDNADTGEEAGAGNEETSANVSEVEAGSDEEGVAEQGDDKAPGIIADDESLRQCESESEGPTAGESQPAVERLEAILNAGFDRLTRFFEGRLSYDRVKEKQIDALHAEVQQHRNDLVAKATRPLAVGVIRLHDDIGKTVEALRLKDPSTLTPDRCLQIIEGFQDDLEIVLEQNGVAAYREVGETFNALRQTAVKTEAAPDPQAVGHVAHRLRPGFERGEEILRKERVLVYGPAAQAPETKESAGEDDAAGSAKESDNV